MELANQLDTPRSKIREAFRLLAQDKLVHIIPQRVTTIAKLNLSATIDSIFIINSLLAAIIKDTMPVSGEIEVAIAKLEREMVSLEKADLVEDDDFFNIDHQFYLLLCKIKNFQRLTNLIFKEKIHIDRAMRLALKQQESCKPIIIFYRKILGSIRSGNRETALNALFELAKKFENYSFRAEKSYPEYFQR